MEGDKVGLDPCDIQLDLSEASMSEGLIAHQNGQNQLIVFLSSDPSNADIDQIRRAIFDANHVSDEQGKLTNEADELITTEGLNTGTSAGSSEHNEQTDHELPLEDDQFICGKCKETFSHLVAFLEHGVEHVTSMASFRCGLCSVKVSRLAALKQHYRHKHGLSNFLKPKQRSNLVSSRKRLVRTIKQPAFDKTTSVTDTLDEGLNNGFNTKSGVTRHSRGHSKGDTANQDFTFVLCTNDGDDMTGFKCLHCDCYTTEKIDMVNHMKNSHLNKMGVSVLDSTAQETTNGNEHLMLMSKFIELTSAKTRNKKAPHWRDKQDKPGVFTCSKCGKVFGRLRNLRRHLDTHRSERSFLCDDCGRGFTTSTYLSIHRKSHKPKFFQCSQCDFTSNSNPAIHAHRQIHSQGSVLCDQCGYAYNDRATLIKHKEVHNMSRPYACTFPNCTWRFKTEMMCRAHIKAHTTEGKFKCTYCGYIFRHKHHLQRHESKLHGVQHSKRTETKTITTEIPITLDSEVDRLQLQLQQPQQIVVTTDNQGTPITYETSDISGMTYQTLLQSQENQTQETCAIFVDSTDGGHIVFQNE